MIEPSARGAPRPQKAKIWLCLTDDPPFFRALAHHPRFEIGHQEEQGANRFTQSSSWNLESDCAEGLIRKGCARVRAAWRKHMWGNYLRKLIDRIKAILLTPQTEWKVIEQEHDTLFDLLIS